MHNIFILGETASGEWEKEGELIGENNNFSPQTWVEGKNVQSKEGRQNFPQVS